MWKVRGLPWHERRIYYKLTSFSVFPFFQLSFNFSFQLLFKFLPLTYHCSTTWIDFRLQTSLICKNEKKKTSSEKWLLGGVLQNSFPKNLSKFTEKYLCGSLSNTAKSFHAVRLATFLKKDPLTGVSEQAVCRSSRK